MKIGFWKTGEFWYFQDQNLGLGIENWSYIYLNLNLDNCNLNRFLYFNNDKIKQLFYKQFNLDIKYPYCISDVKKENPQAYQWLKENFGKGLYYFSLYYNDKNELKPCVKKYIKVKIKREL